MPRIDNPASPLVAKLEGAHLFHFDGAPCAQRVRFALAEKGLNRGKEVKFTAEDANACRAETGTWTSRIVSLVKKDHVTADYAAIHPNLVVPAFVHDGVLHLESMDIIAYLDDAFGGAPLVPKNNPVQLADAEALTELGKEMHRSIRFVTFRWGLGRLGRLNSKEESKLRELIRNGNDSENLVDFYSGFDNNSIDEQVYIEHLNRLLNVYADLEKRLSDGRAFLTGDNVTMADVIWAMKNLRLTECGFPFRERYPAVTEWYERMYNRPAFQSGVMGKHRALNKMFLVKSGFEKMIGVGLSKAIQQHAYA